MRSPIESRERRALKTPPKFKNEAAERAFWESHDSSEYVDWSRAQRVQLPKEESGLSAITRARDRSAP
jgi:hypothetical protein